VDQHYLTLELGSARSPCAGDQEDVCTVE